MINCCDDIELGCKDNGENATVFAAGAIRTFWIEPNDSLKDHTPEQTQASILRGIAEISSVCGMEFERKSSEHQAIIKIKMVPGPEIDNSLGRRTGNLIRLNRDRPIGLKRNPLSRIPEALAIHELLHVFGFGHGGERQDIMHAHLGSWFRPANVKRLQRQFQLPPRIFHPAERVSYSPIIAETKAVLEALRARRPELIEIRNNLTDKDQRAAAQEEVLKNLRKIETEHAKISEAVKNWHRANAKWRNSDVEMVG